MYESASSLRRYLEMIAPMLRAEQVRQNIPIMANRLVRELTPTEGSVWPILQEPSPIRCLPYRGNVFSGSNRG